MGNFKKLMVWQKAKDAAVKIYQISENNPFQKDFGLKDQIRRAAISVPSNIAEGDELRSNKQSNHYFYTAKASAAEVITQLFIAQEVDYITEQNLSDLVDDYEHISIMLHHLIKARNL